MLAAPPPGSRAALFLPRLAMNSVLSVRLPGGAHVPWAVPESAVDAGAVPREAPAPRGQQHPRSPTATRAAGAAVEAATADIAATVPEEGDSTGEAAEDEGEPAGSAED
jgi:hypothetical protein